MNIFKLLFGNDRYANEIVCFPEISQEELSKTYSKDCVPTGIRETVVSRQYLLLNPVWQKPDNNVTYVE